MLKAGILSVVILLLIIGCSYDTRPGDEDSSRVDQSRYQPGPAPTTDNPLILDQNPLQIYEELPLYPSLARMNNIEGHVIIMAYIDKTGAVTKAKATLCSQPDLGFEEAAVEAAYKCRYQPAIMADRAVGCWVEYQVNFKLQDD
jgi:TonB family protein